MLAEIRRRRRVLRGGGSGALGLLAAAWPESASDDSGLTESGERFHEPGGTARRGKRG